MEGIYMTYLDHNTVFLGSVALILLAWLIRLPVMCRPKHFTYQYAARTRFEKQDHTYIFRNVMMKNGFYRCYIKRAPFLFGKRFSRYTIDYGYDKEIGKCYILSTRKVGSVEEAKALCAEWNNFNQYVIDSHRYDI